MLVIICTCRMGASNLKLILISFTWDCTTYHNFFSMLKKKNLFYASWKMAHGYADIAMRRYRAGPLNILIFKKLAGLWWAGEVVNHIWIYGSKVAEGSSAFQRRSCVICAWVRSPKYSNSIFYQILKTLHKTCQHEKISIQLLNETRPNRSFQIEMLVKCLSGIYQIEIHISEHQEGRARGWHIWTTLFVISMTM